MADFLLRAATMGIVATAALDLWGVLLNRTLGIPMANWGLIGRWFCHVAQGTYAHADIGAAAPFEQERAVGWTMHYLIGILFAAVTLALAGSAWIKAPTPFWPLVVGWVTIGCGWFILQPGMGAGIAASRRPDALRVRILNILGHTVFGLGMFAAALALR
ncbi:DUF2938 family protein [Prosthecomicrobium sp. N25]|uniref:DUF2938 family protein n=1 Tax=Prosthecomicrobium sp. N25 TaxID=3129254 RepID=UPI003076CD18